MLSSRMIPGLMSRGGAGIGLSFVRSVTDIHHYKQVDQSHLQLKVAESSLTRFKNKLKEREARQDQAVQREKIQTQHLQEEISPAPPPSKVKVPLYIERKPTDILK